MTFLLCVCAALYELVVCVAKAMVIITLTLGAAISLPVWLPLLVADKLRGRI